MEIQTVYDHKRGCGYRHEKACYFRSDITGWIECGKLPIPLTVCPYCHGGIKVTRVPQKINLKMLADKIPCDHADNCVSCLLAHTEWAYLMSVGEKFYPTPAAFMEEAMRLGVSKRIPNRAIPRGFVVGESVIALAHKKACVVYQEPTFRQPEGPETEYQAELPGMTPEYKPGIFTLWKPTSIEYVCKGDETEDELQSLVRRGITPVNVVQLNDNPDSPPRYQPSDCRV